MIDNACYYCDGSGVICKDCQSNIGCECEDYMRIEVTCPECNGTGDNENEGDEE